MTLTHALKPNGCYGILCAPGFYPGDIWRGTYAGMRDVVVVGVYIRISPGRRELFVNHRKVDFTVHDFDRDKEVYTLSEGSFPEALPPCAASLGYSSDFVCRLCAQHDARFMLRVGGTDDETRSDQALATG